MQACYAVKLPCRETLLEVQCVVSRDFKFFMSHITTVPCCMLTFSVFVLCFLLVCLISFLILQLAPFLLSCYMNNKELSCGCFVFIILCFSEYTCLKFLCLICGCANMVVARVFIFFEDV
jgi:hypothetical protein